MSSLTLTLQTSLRRFENFLGFASSYFQKNNLMLQFKDSIIRMVKDFLTANKKLKIVQYRVNHLNYRMRQMENLIDSNNPYNVGRGKTLDFLR